MNILIVGFIVGVDRDKFQVQVPDLVQDPMNECIVFFIPGKNAVLAITSNLHSFKPFLPGLIKCSSYFYFYLGIHSHIGLI